jgi:hypothetical protein
MNIALIFSILFNWPIVSLSQMTCIPYVMIGAIVLNSNIDVLVDRLVMFLMYIALMAAAALSWMWILKDVAVF